MRILLFGVTVLLLMASCNGKTESVEDYEYHQYLNQLEKTVEEMTELQKQQFIIDGEEMLEKLQKEVESDSIDPETRFDNRRSISLIKKEMDIVRKSMTLK